MKGDVEIHRVVEEHRDSPCSVTQCVERVSVEELDEIRNGNGKGVPVQNKELNVTQRTGIAMGSSHPDPDHSMKRFKYESDDDVPTLGLPSTFQNEDSDEDSTKFVTADDGKKVPSLGLPATFNQK